MFNRDHKLSNHYWDTFATQNTNQMLLSIKCKDWEFRFIITIWVKLVFDKAYANHLFGLFSKFSLNKLLLIILLLQPKSFIILDRIIKAKVFHEIISFENMRINKNNQLIIYNFDMAIETNGKNLGLRERMDIIEFMAKDILNGQSHQVFYNCKYVYQFCFIMLLQKYASSRSRNTLRLLQTFQQNFII